MAAVPRTGYYDNTSEFIRDAIRTLLASRRDLRAALACVLYEQEEVSLGKAAEIAEVSIEEMKRMLVERGIALKRGASPAEAEARSEKALALAGRERRWSSPTPTS